MRYGGLKNRIKTATKQALELYPGMFILLLKLKTKKERGRRRIVSREHDMVIDGFPRSATSFALHALLEAQSPGRRKKLFVATHVHSSAQILKAAQWDIPCMVNVRDPLEAITALMAFDRQLASKRGVKPEETDQVTRGEVLVRAQQWKFFYKRLFPVRGSVFIADFNDIVSDYGALTERFIKRFLLDLVPYSRENVPEEDIFKKGFHVGPDAERGQIKKLIQDRVRYYSEHPLLLECRDIYKRLGSD